MSDDRLAVALFADLEWRLENDVDFRANLEMHVEWSIRGARVVVYGPWLGEVGDA